MWTNTWKHATALLIVSASFGATREQDILTAQRRWIDGYNRHDERAVASIEADDFHITFGDGSVQTKKDQLERLLKRLPPGAEYELAVDSSEVHLYGKAAVVTGIVVERGKIMSGQGAFQPFSQRSR
jgi:hypothetical protein